MAARSSLEIVSMHMKNSDIESLKLVENILSQRILNQSIVESSALIHSIGAKDGRVHRDKISEGFIPKDTLKGEKKFFALRSEGSGNCLYSSASLSMFGDNTLCEELRVLTSIELFCYPEFYSKHPCFYSAFNSQEASMNKRSLDTFFTMSLKNATIDSGKRFEEAVKFEAIHNCINFQWSSFLCILALSSVIKRNIRSFFPDNGSELDRILKNQIIEPRVSCNSNSEKQVNILFCRTCSIVSPISLKVSPVFQANHFVPLLSFYTKSSRMKSPAGSASPAKVPKLHKKNSQTKIKFNTVQFKPFNMPPLLYVDASIKVEKNNEISSFSGFGAPKKALTSSKEHNVPKQVHTPANNSFFTPTAKNRVAKEVLSPLNASIKIEKKNEPSSFSSFSAPTKTISMSSSNEDNVPKKVHIPNTSFFTQSASVAKKEVVSPSTAPSKLKISSNTNQKVPLTTESILKKKRDIGTFYKLCAAGITDTKKLDLIKNVFIPDKSYCFQTNFDNHRKNKVNNQKESNDPKKKKYNRNFSLKWLKEFDWIGFSHIEQGAFCLPCTLFCGKRETQAKRLVSLPFVHYSDATRSFKNHVEAKDGIHTRCSYEYSIFLQQMAGKSQPMNVVMNTRERIKVDNNRSIILSIIDTVKTCGRMGIALRGHRDDSKYHPPVGESASHGGVGNFVEMINFAIRHGDNVLKNHRLTCSSRATYISYQTQNDLLKCCYDVMTKSIIDEVKISKFFSILADEACDVSNKEQLSLCLRFVDANNDIREEFLKFIICDEGVCGIDLYKQITTGVLDFGLDIMDCRGQGYDGAGVITGHINGLAARILADNNKALYTHCFNHRLNLAVSHSCKVLSIKNTMDHIREVSDFFNNSPLRQQLLEKFLKEICPLVGKKNLINVCKTRWIARIDGVDLFELCLEAIVATLEHMYLNTDKKINDETSKRASTFLKLVCNFDFIVNLVVLRNILDYTRDITILLQSSANDIVKGIEFVHSTVAKLEFMRENCELHHDDWYKQALDLASKVHVNESRPRNCFRQQFRANHPAETPSQYYKRSLTLPILDNVLNQLKSRFSTENMIVIEGFYVIPYILKSSLFQKDKVSWRDHFKKFLKFYKEDFLDINMKKIDGQLGVWEQHWINFKGSCPDDVSTTLKAVDMMGMFDIIKRALRIIGTIPVTSCCCERSFSNLRRLKHYTRSTMTNQRLNALAMLNIHLDINPTGEQILERFIAMKPHRMQFDL